MTAMAEEVDDRFAGIDIDSLLNRTERRPFTYGRKKTLYEAPEFIKRLQGEETVMEGQSLCIDCKVAGFPVPTLRWFKDDEEITDHPRIQVESNGKGGYSLMIVNVNKGDEACYRCRAENVEGATSSCFFLSVKAKPKSKKKKDSKSAPNRRTVSFPPMFATIVEKVEEEEKQGKELQHLPPSPMTEFYYALTLKSRQSWPSFVGDWAFANGPERRRTAEDEDEEEDEEHNEEPPSKVQIINGSKGPQSRDTQDSLDSRKPPVAPKLKNEPVSKFLQEEGDKGESQLRRRRRQRQENNTDSSNVENKENPDKSNYTGVSATEATIIPKNDLSQENSSSIKNKEQKEMRTTLACDKEETETSASKYQKMKEELMRMEEDLVKKLEAKKKRTEDELRQQEEKRRQETLAKIEADKARLREEDRKRSEIKKQLEDDRRRIEDEERKAAEKLNSLNVQHKKMGDSGSSQQKNVDNANVMNDKAKTEPTKRNGPAALAMFQNKFNKTEEHDKKGGTPEAFTTQSKNVAQEQAQKQNKTSIPKTPFEAMRQREQEQIDNLKQREKQQIDELRKKEQKQLEEFRSKQQSQKSNKNEEIIVNNEKAALKKLPEAINKNEKLKTVDENKKDMEKEKEEKAKENSQIFALRGKEMKQREDLNARESQQKEDLRIKDIRLREDMRKSHERADEEEKQKKEDEKRRALERDEDDRRLQKKKENLRMEQLRRQHEEDERKRKERAHEKETQLEASKVNAATADDDIKVYKRDYSFQDLRKSLETQLGGDVINEREHKYWDEILQKHNYSVSDIKKSLDPGVSTEKPVRLRSRRNSVEEAELLKLQRSGSLADLRETYTRSLGRPKKKPLDAEKTQKDEMFLKRAASISDLRQQFLEVAHKPPSGTKFLNVPGRQEAEITIRNRKPVSDTLRPSEIRQRSKSPTPAPFFSPAASSIPLQQFPESKQLARKQTELMKLTGTVAAKKASLNEMLGDKSQKEGDATITPGAVAKRRNFGRDSYGSREIPAYKLAAGWSDDIGKTSKAESSNIESQPVKDKQIPVAVEAEKNKTKAQLNKDPCPQKKYVSSKDITDRPFLYNSTRTTARNSTGSIYTESDDDSSNDEVFSEETSDSDVDNRSRMADSGVTSGPRPIFYVNDDFSGSDATHQGDLIIFNKNAVGHGEDLKHFSNDPKSLDSNKDDCTPLPSDICNVISNESVTRGYLEDDILNRNTLKDSQNVEAFKNLMGSDGVKIDENGDVIDNRSGIYLGTSPMVKVNKNEDKSMSFTSKGGSAPPIVVEMWDETEEIRSSTLKSSESIRLPSTSRQAGLLVDREERESTPFFKASNLKETQLLGFANKSNGTLVPEISRVEREPTPFYDNTTIQLKTDETALLAPSVSESKFERELTPFYSPATGSLATHLSASPFQMNQQVTQRSFDKETPIIKNQTTMVFEKDKNLSNSAIAEKNQENLKANATEGKKQENLRGNATEGNKQDNLGANASEGRKLEHFSENKMEVKNQEKIMKDKIDARTTTQSKNTNEHTGKVYCALAQPAQPFQDLYKPDVQRSNNNKDSVKLENNSFSSMDLNNVNNRNDKSAKSFKEKKSEVQTFKSSVPLVKNVKDGENVLIKPKDKVADMKKTHDLATSENSSKTVITQPDEQNKDVAAGNKEQIKGESVPFVRRGRSETKECKLATVEAPKPRALSVPRDTSPIIAKTQGGESSRRKLPSKQAQSSNTSGKVRSPIMTTAISSSENSSRSIQSKSNFSAIGTALSTTVKSTSTLSTQDKATTSRDNATNFVSNADSAVAINVIQPKAPLLTQTPKAKSLRSRSSPSSLNISGVNSQLFQGTSTSMQRANPVVSPTTLSTNLGACLLETSKSAAITDSSSQVTTTPAWSVTVSLASSTVPTLQNSAKLQSYGQLSTSPKNTRGLDDVASTEIKADHNIIIHKSATVPQPDNSDNGCTSMSGAIDNMEEKATVKRKLNLAGRIKKTMKSLLPPSDVKNRISQDSLPSDQSTCLQSSATRVKNVSIELNKSTGLECASTKSDAQLQISTEDQTSSESIFQAGRSTSLSFTEISATPTVGRKETKPGFLSGMISSFNKARSRSDKSSSLDKTAAKKRLFSKARPQSDQPSTSPSIPGTEAPALPTQKSGSNRPFSKKSLSKYSPFGSRTTEGLCFLILMTILCLYLDMPVEKFVCYVLATFYTFCVLRLIGLID